MPPKKQPPKQPPPEAGNLHQRLAEAEAFARLATRLAASVTVDDIVNVVREESEKLLGWDSFYFALRRPGDNAFRFLLLVDTIDGQKRVFPADEGRTPELGPIFQKVVEEKCPLPLNRKPGEIEPKLTRFGDTTRLSASLLFAPIISQEEVIGVISAHSYTYDRYDKNDLYLLARIADIVSPALTRTHIEEILQKPELIREDEYFVDDRNKEFEKLLRTIEASPRHSADNKARFKIILNALFPGERINKQQIEAALAQEGFKLPANPSGFIRERLNSMALRHGFTIVSDGNAYRLRYKPRAKAIIFFSTEANDAEHLVNILRAIDRSDRETLESSGFKILEAGGIIGDADVFCLVEGESTDLILSKLLSILHNSQRTSYSKVRGKYLTAAEIIIRTHTYPVAPGMRWQRRENSSE